MEDNNCDRQCFFTGHRTIPDGDLGLLSASVDAEIERCYAEGFRTFICGGAVGFDTLAACRVAVARKRHTDIELFLILPCRNQTEKWKNSPRDRQSRVRSPRNLLRKDPGTAEAAHRARTEVEPSPTTIISIPRCRQTEKPCRTQNLLQKTDLWQRVRVHRRVRKQPVPLPSKWRNPRRQQRLFMLSRTPPGVRVHPGCSDMLWLQL